MSHYFFNATATTAIYTLSLHDALPISIGSRHLPRLRIEFCGQSQPADRLSGDRRSRRIHPRSLRSRAGRQRSERLRSEEHTSELQSRRDLVCRLLLEKKKHICYL